MDFIKLKDIVKYYSNSYLALKGVNLAIKEGEFIALMGASGSGKSTMANILGCLDSPSSGEYEFCGVKVHKLRRYERSMLRRHYMSFIFQSFNLLARMNALENVELPLVYKGMSKKKRYEKAMEALEMVGLKDHFSHTSDKLSGGQQQRVAIARAIANEPKFLLADEPTGNLDSLKSVEIMQILSSLNKQRNITILMVTHEEDMASYASRRLVFKDGNILKDSKDN